MTRGYLTGPSGKKREVPVGTVWAIIITLLIVIPVLLLIYWHWIPALIWFLVLISRVEA